MSRILITGAKGFIGTHIGTFYKNKGEFVIGWDLFADKENNIKSVNLLESVSVKNNLEEDQPDVIIHCAGCADVSKSVEAPDIDFDGNVKMVHNLLFGLKKCHRLNTKILFLSSAAVYGNPDVLPMSEDSKLKPMSPYALHKILGEQICQYFIENYQMDIKIARIFSAYGNGLRKQIFWDMRQKIKNTNMLNMFGTGKESRDYIHINDIVQAIDLILNKSPKGEVIYNIANGEETTIRQVAQKFAKISGIPEDKVIFDNVGKEGQPLNWQADITKLTRLGYKNSMSLDQGIEQYIEWCNLLERN